ncbi:hypothetical protein E6O75_ATG08159 [Venturia nashicola]|uniref:Uncharacterized protein n=1 Tax=Venturia nashicola TaxID=86259 RepID=A0A4Z1P9D7_9PEZI|nr:hypothetical protein E6O75_ATG08159 [Venturia nashicola]
MLNVEEDGIDSGFRWKGGVFACGLVGSSTVLTVLTFFESKAKVALALDSQHLAPGTWAGTSTGTWAGTSTGTFTGTSTGTPTGTSTGTSTGSFTGTSTGTPTGTPGYFRSLQYS